MAEPQLQMVDVVGQYRRIQKEVDDAVRKVLDSGRFILGPEVAEFEGKVAGYLGSQYAVACASGTDALQVAMMALGIGPGDEVITTPFSFVATTETIALLGARPVYLDIDPETFNINPAGFEKAITPRTKAIIPVHLYGQAADMDPILQIAGKHGIAVIEDSAQALGADYKGKKVCTFGDIGCISFFPSKNLGCFGDGGMMVTDNADLWEKMKVIVSHGSRTRYHHDVLGVNSRLDTIQAAILAVKLRYLDEWNEARRRFAERYDHLLAGLPVVPPKRSADCKHIFHQYTLRVPDRDRLAEALASQKIPHGVYYPIPLHLQRAYADSGYHAGNFPEAEKAAHEVISLPMHTELNDDQQRFVTDAVRRFYTKQ
jgi:dTDP-4-amino-4,6-dideoxygalactose transaminase